MKLFGRHNTTATQGTGEVPPELQPYYVAQKGKNRRLRAWLGLLLILIIIVGAATGASVWIRNRMTSQPHHATSGNSSSNHATNGQSASNNVPQLAPSGNSGSTTSSNPAASSTTSSSASQQDTTQPSAATPSASSPSASSAIPNTGPGDNLFVIAPIAGLAAALYYHVRQLRRVRH